jgi:hypothetical protein
MTAGQQAIADGFAATLAEHGQAWTRTADGAVIYGVACKLKPDNPHMAGAQDEDFPVFVADRSLSPPLPIAWVMPATRLKKGDELTKNTKNFRVVRADYEEATALWTVVFSPTF